MHRRQGAGGPTLKKFAKIGLNRAEIGLKSGEIFVNNGNFIGQPPKFYHSLRPCLEASTTRNHAQNNKLWMDSEGCNAVIRLTQNGLPTQNVLLTHRKIGPTQNRLPTQKISPTQVYSRKIISKQDPRPTQIHPWPTRIYPRPTTHDPRPTQIFWPTQPTQFSTLL